MAADQTEARLSRRRVEQIERSADQAALFGDPALFHRDARLDGTESTWAAAKRSPGYRSRLAADILRALQVAGPAGLTDGEIAERFPDSSAGSCSKRRHDLTVRGQVKNSGTTRRSKFGSPQIVWVVAS